MTVTGGASGSGSGAVNITVAANPTTTVRVGTVTIAGQTLTVTQAAAPCTYVLATTAQSFTAAAGTGSVNGHRSDWLRGGPRRVTRRG